MTATHFEFRSVSRVYAGSAALADASFTVTAGEPAALLGPSGCGKTTALRLLAGLEAPTTGEILLDDKVVSTAGRILLPPHRRGVAMVFQDLALWPNLSVLRNVLLGLAGARLSRRESRARAQEALALCGLEALAERLPGHLSGGQQQRVALARAAAVRPAFLVLDEPFSGLDLLSKERLLQEIGTLSRQRQITVLLVTHDPLDATALCRSAIVLEGGRVVEKGPLQDLLKAPRSELLRLFQSRLGGLAVVAGPLAGTGTAEGDARHA
ncbi:MAG TPA: ATP-binding cassette domain-containing protein [Gemmataceae bacterium]|nr:ATP-binding cassette domain-containing protein [Gemmataceae bacterium]